jgi:hypothetical protein
MATLGSKIVLFGGTVGGNETWEFDGTTWTERTPATIPSARQLHSMAAAAGKIVMFGGFVSGSGATNETWLWDGNDWSQPTLSSAPSPRRSAAFASVGTGAVLFGGMARVSSSNVYYGDTWVWDGNSWSSPTTTTAPSAREYAAMTSLGSGALLFGGDASGYYVGDSWLWNGSTWSQVTTTSAPAARTGHAMATLGTKVTLFGGSTNSGEEGDTWTFDGSAWSLALPQQAPAVGAQGHAMAALAGNVVACGSGLDVANATWVFDGVKWSQHVTTSSPCGRNGHVMATLGTKVVLFGGLGSNDTWEWDGADWKQRVLPIAPPARAYAAMAPLGTSLVLFGGMTGSAYTPAVSNDMWSYDGTSWSFLAPTTKPSARQQHGMVPVAGNRLVMFGGKAADNTAFGDTWEWDGSSWTQKMLSTSPSPRSQFAMTALGQRAALFGGAPPTGGFLSDLWIYDGAAWTVRTAATAPAGRSLGAMAPLGNGALLVGGGSIEEPWLLRDTFDDGSPCTSDVDCDSGFCTDGFCCNARCNGVCEACAAKVTGATDGTCAAVTKGTDPHGSCLDDGAPTCARDGFCDGARGCERYASTTCNSNACTTGSDCASGFCVDGVCCDRACNGGCEACTKALKGSGVDGICGGALAGTNPRGVCVADPGYPGSCQSDGTCDGAGACRKFAPLGIACGPSTCASGTIVGPACDGAGSCSQLTHSCAPYASCKDASSCAANCTTGSDCAQGSYCVSGRCVSQLANGEAATDATACQSGFVADGVCCDRACGGICEACDLATTKGTCTPVLGKPEATHGACPGAPASGDACAAKTCDGKTGASCEAFVGPEVVCRASACASDVQTLEAKCESKGTCPASTSLPCSPYACGTSECKASCVQNTDCASGFVCDVAHAKCISGTTCDGEHTVTSPRGDQTDCTPFKCGSGGCLESCEDSSQCVVPAICDPVAGKCVAPATTSGSGGCSAGRVATSGPGWLCAALVALAMQRRRRASSQPPT